MHLKSSKVCIITRSPLASFLFKGLATKHATVKWTIIDMCEIVSLGPSGGIACVPPKAADFLEKLD